MMEYSWQAAKCKVGSRYVEFLFGNLPKIARRMMIKFRRAGLSRKRSIRVKNDFLPNEFKYKENLLYIIFDMEDIFDIINNKFDINSETANKETDNETCKNCGNDNCLIKDEGMIVCESCGTMQSIYLDTNQEWRNFGAENDHRGGESGARCGAYINELLPEGSLATLIMGRGLDQLKKINNWNAMSYRERMLLRIFKRLQEKADDGTLPNCIIERAKVMYKVLCDDNINRGKSRDPLIGACIYYSCKDRNMTLSMDEIADLLEINPKLITSGCKKFNELMAINNCGYSKKIEPINEFDYIEKYCNKMDINERIRRKIVDLATICRKLNITIEHTPQTIAFCCIKFINDIESEGIDIDKLQKFVKISKNTTSKLYKILTKYQKYLSK